MHLYKIYKGTRNGFSYVGQYRAKYPNQVWSFLRDSQVDGTFYWGTSKAWQRYVTTGDFKGIYRATFAK